MSTRPDTGYAPALKRVVGYLDCWSARPGDEVAVKVSAELVFFEHPGGTVFSVGSMSWIGARGHDDQVARITENVLRRFLDPEPFR